MQEIKTIWIDIFHTPQFNFYKMFIVELASRGYEVNVTILKRGRTPQIVQHEMGGVEHVHLYFVGKHRMKYWSVILEANLLRIFQLLWWRLWHNGDVAFSNGFHAAMISWWFCKKSYSFDDDPQTIDFKPKKRFNTECNFCLFEDEHLAHMGGNVQILRCLKEWAYLAPNVFQPNPKVLEKYGVKPKQYIFLREVSVGTVNYAGQAAGAIRDVAGMIEEVIGKREEVRGKNDETFHVLFSLEEKNRRSEYPADWILLQEPIEDIHSLIYYSAGLVSSGDSMAREAALLGVPSYYLGVRHSMPANLAASKVAGLQNTLTMPFEQWLNEVRGGDIERIEDRTNRMMQEQEALRKKIDNDFIDINAYMMSLVEKVEQEHNNESSKKI